jgi:hypothetical protein
MISVVSKPEEGKLMSNVFAGKKIAKETIDEDYVPSGGIFDSDIYQAKIKTAYIGKAQSSEARNVTLLLDINGKELRSQTWVSNKAGEVTYKDKNSGEIKNLPGYNQMNSLALLIAGKNLGDLDTEELVVKIYDFDAKKELPQSVTCFTELHGETVNVAVQRQTVDKTAKNDATGDYDATGETRDQNEIVKFFAADKLVTISEVAEFIKGLGESFDDVVDNGHLLKAIRKVPEENGLFADKWLTRNKGQTYDKSTGKKAVGKSFESVGKSSSESGKAKASSLFDD